MQLTKRKSILLAAKTDEQKQLASILDAENKQIGYFTKPESASLVDVISKWRYYVGVSNDINSAELVFMTEFLVNNYGELTVPELNLAINLSLKGELNVNTSTYGAFSVLYVSSILNAYLDHKAKLIRQIAENDNENYQKYIQSQSLPVPEANEMAKDMRDILLNKFVTYKGEGYFVDPLFYIFNFLKKRGDFSGFSKQEINKIKEDAERLSDQQLTKDKFSSPLLNAISIDKDSNYVRVGRRLMVESFFNKFLSESHFMTYLESITEKDFYGDNNRKDL